MSAAEAARCRHPGSWLCVTGEWTCQTCSEFSDTLMMLMAAIVAVLTFKHSHSTKLRCWRWLVAYRCTASLMKSSDSQCTAGTGKA